MHLALPGLLPSLRTGVTAVTSSYFLAQLAAHNYANDCLAQGLESWRTPQVFSASAWLKACWEQARYSKAEVPALLSAAQEQALWQRIIEDQTPGLFDVASTARLASRAYALINEWHLPLESEAWEEQEDAKQFQSWREVFRDYCRHADWISVSDLWRLVPDWIVWGLWGTRVAFAGFSTLSPALRRLRDALGSSAAFLQFEARTVAGPVEVRRCNELAEELEIAARWARAAWEKDRESAIGVFVPGLASNRALVERIFGQICYPGRAHAHFRESVFHSHAAAALQDVPLIAGAMLLLQVARPRMDIGAGGAILRSPWIEGAAEESNERARADLHLRRTRELDVTLRDLEYSAKSCPRFLILLQRVKQLCATEPSRADFAFWSEFFSDILSALGWRGAAELNSEEQQLVEIWKEKLSTLASLTLISERATYDEALARLEKLLSEPGPARGDFFSPIQILDSGQAAGVLFDRAFVVGLSEGNELVRTQRSPLIPPRLQRASGVPGASANSLRQESEQALKDLFSCAADVCATYSDRILPAATSYVSAASDQWQCWDGRTPKQSFAPAELEKVEDTNAPPYRNGTRSLGGTGLIKDQSQCPFRAFAARRLNARAPEEGCFGFDSRDRGGFVHEALSAVWTELKTQRALRDYPPLQLQFLVQEAVAKAVRTRNKGPLHEQLSLAETDRLVQVILDWLELERERKIPFEVEDTEQKRPLDIAGLHLEIRMDRIDRLNNGRRVLVDYKSGETSVSNLNGERPKEPQLLAYAASMPHQVDGMFFGQLKPRAAQLAGYARDMHIAGQKPPAKDLSWDEYLDDRIAVVEGLAQSFMAGEAAVDPVRGACDYCDLTPLCRVNELRCGENKDNDDE
ncbi:MAG: PD-(D/E)XK nuclease family protein [Acidobacteriaceae bacterium]|nr:PD-(D/E)XK nuclease family protein [Acidobacteriaceae bacterium]